MMGKDRDDLSLFFPPSYEKCAARSVDHAAGSSTYF